MDLTRIKSQKLRDLVQASFKFNAMPKEEQEKAVEKMSQIAKEENIAKLCEFFANENEKDEDLKKEVLREQIKQLEELNEKIQVATKQIKKMVLQEEEKKSGEEEDKHAEELLKQLGGEV
jgi:transposase